MTLRPWISIVSRYEVIDLLAAVWLHVPPVPVPGTKGCDSTSMLGMCRAIAL